MNIHNLICIISILIFIQSGCTNNQETIVKDDVPTWTLSTNTPDENFVYSVGFGQSNSTSVVKQTARQNAIRLLFHRLYTEPVNIQGTADSLTLTADLVGYSLYFHSIF